MKFAALCSLALSTLPALGAELQSKPFFLELISSNSTVNNAQLVSCHEGALIQGLCFLPGYKSNKASRTFYYNTTHADSKSGELVFINSAIGPHNKVERIPQAMTYLFSFGSNVLGLDFGGGTKNELFPVSFDKNERMYISEPDVYVNGVVNNYGVIALYRWAICVYPFLGYDYHELVWQLGEGPLSYKDCQSVGVKRVFQS